MKATYINPFTDFGFKKIFGEEASKLVLMDFLRCLLPEINIVDLAFKDKEGQAKTMEERKAIFDIYCETKEGEQIIIELQKAKQNYFKDRTVFYASFPIQKQAEKGEWNFKLKAVYCIGILDFKFDDSSAEKEEVIHMVQLKDQNNKVFYNKLKFVYLEMPHFKLAEDELKTRLDKWLYFIKHLDDFEAIPKIFEDAIFVQAFETAKIANYTQQELDEYEDSLKNYRDLKNVIDTAFVEGEIKGIGVGRIEGKMEGRMEGRMEEKAGLLKIMIKAGEPIEKIIEYTGLTREQIEKLL